MLSERLVAAGVRCAPVSTTANGLRLDLHGADAEDLGPAVGILASTLRVRVYMEADEATHSRAYEVMREAPQPAWLQTTLPHALLVSFDTPVQKLNAWVDTLDLPDGASIRWERGEIGYLPHVLDRHRGGPIGVTATALRPPDPSQPRWLQLVLDRAGNELLTRLSTDYTKERMAILIDEQIVSLPVVAEPIPGGRFMIFADRWAPEEARLLVAGLPRPLPTPLVVERTEVLPSTP